MIGIDGKTYASVVSSVYEQVCLCPCCLCFANETSLGMSVYSISISFPAERRVRSMSPSISFAIQNRRLSSVRTSMCCGVSLMALTPLIFGINIKNDPYTVSVLMLQEHYTMQGSNTGSDKHQKNIKRTIFSIRIKKTSNTPSNKYQTAIFKRYSNS